ncbi:MAG: HlyD family efflux transporter periplasmic adaptor subunit [Anaerolineales bacterium]
MKKSIFNWMVLIVILALGLSACANQQTPSTQDNASGPGSNTAPPTPVVSGATASGFVVADQQASMAFKLEGNVKLVQVKTGDPVRAGQVLVQLDDASEQIALDQATLTLQQLTSPAALAVAEQTVAADQQTLDNAQSGLNNQLYYTFDATAIQNAEANLTLANNNLSNAQKAYSNVGGDPNKDALKALAYQRLYNAQQADQSAINSYNWWTGKPDQEEINLRTSQLALAKAKLAEDQTLVSVLEGDPLPSNATGAGMVQLRQAYLAVDQAQANLDATRLVAPFDGEVGNISISIGDYISPGQPILVVSDTKDLHVETTDLSERDVPSVKIGQEVTVSIKALNQDVKGRVSAISPVSDTLGGDVVYKVNIILNELPAGLRAGMSVDVQINTGQ